MKIKSVILCGGSGTRLWPISRSDLPKQFVKFKPNEKSNTLFKQAMYRGTRISDEIPLILASTEYRYLIAGQLKEMSLKAEIFFEPVARNTAPSLTMAALSLLAKEEDDPIMVVLPSDQYIDDQEFKRVLELAFPACKEGSIALVGISPKYPETGYGYIKAKSKETLSEVVEFCEKPDLETAKEYLRSGLYFWNSGIFVLKASTWMKALHACRPDIYTASLEAFEKKEALSDHEISVGKEVFEKIPSESVDYAVLEKCAAKGISLKVVPFFKHWNDLGSWKSVYDALGKDAEHNFVQGHAVVNETTGSLVVSTSRPIVVNGLKGVAVVEMNDAVLVTALNESQSIKQTVDQLKSISIPEATQHRKGYRPWGWYDVLEEGDTFKVKRIYVKPGESLSLQRHSRRAEHWLVIGGEATVQLGETVLHLSTGESVYIPKREIHRLKNETQNPVYIIETQIGDYLGEDDIERLEDIYGRGK